jgi:hypothetical protein
MDIWGFVTNASGSPIENASVSDGAIVYSTDANGYFDLEELQFGTYGVDATAIGCDDNVRPVSVSPAVLLTGNGERQDFVLTCR